MVKEIFHILKTYIITFQYINKKNYANIMNVIIFFLIFFYKINYIETFSYENNNFTFNNLSYNNLILNKLNLLDINQSSLNHNTNWLFSFTENFFSYTYNITYNIFNSYIYQENI